jgi:hypothetical protein
LTFSEDRSRELAINTEMLSLARRWRSDFSASLETRCIAMLLEGRCIGKLASATARRGDVAEALRLLFNEESYCSLTPAFALVCGSLDWVVQHSIKPAVALLKKLAHGR